MRSGEARHPSGARDLFEKEHGKKKGNIFKKGKRIGWYQCVVGQEDSVVGQEDMTYIAPNASPAGTMLESGSVGGTFFFFRIVRVIKDPNVMSGSRLVGMMVPAINPFNPFSISLSEHRCPPCTTPPVSS